MMGILMAHARPKKSNTHMNKLKEQIEDSEFIVVDSNDFEDLFSDNFPFTIPIDFTLLDLGKPQFLIHKLHL